jgi:hypothetical protein
MRVDSIHIEAAPVQDPTLDAWNTLTAALNVKVEPLADFLNRVNRKTLPRDEKVAILGAVRILLRPAHIYPHLPYKQDRFGIDPVTGADPVERLKALFGISDAPDVPIDGSLTDNMDDLDFHIALLDAFASVRDLHTVYFLPGEFRGAIAFLPFQVGFYVENGRNRFVVTRVMSTTVPNAFGDFQPGVELLAWDSNAMDDAVSTAAQLRPGANDAAKALLGTSLLTLRSISTAGVTAWGKPPFRSLVTTIHYQVHGGGQHKIILPWGVGTGFDAGATIPNSAFSMSRELCETWQAGKMLWCREELAPVPVPTEDATPHATAAPLSTVRLFETQFTGGVAVPGFVSPKDLVTTNPEKSGAKFGYLGIRAFRTDELNTTEALVDAFREILTDLDEKAPDGLILDIRGNPGGDIKAAEHLLQMLTPKTIEPALFHLALTPFIRDFLATVPNDSDLFPWKHAAETPLEDGRLTAGHPITSKHQANSIGQIYQGPVVLLIDALTYSAAEIFAGGFRDNGIGTVIGVDANTGGGGANVWHYDDLVSNLPSLGLPPAPRDGATMQMAIRRSSRVNRPPGAPTEFIEDIGVKCDVQYLRTLEDMTLPSPSLIRMACDELAKATVHRIDVHSHEAQPGNILNVTLTPRNITQLLFRGNEVRLGFSTTVSPGTKQTVPIEFDVTNPFTFDTVQIRGFDVPAGAPVPEAEATPAAVRTFMLRAEEDDD